MAETIVLMFEGETDHNSSLGKELDADFCLKIGELAQAHGFTTARLRGINDEPISPERLTEFLALAGLRDQLQPVVADFTNVPD